MKICLFHTDKEVFKMYVREKLDGNIRSYILSFMANMKPVEQVLILWDYYMTNGFYNNILVLTGLLIELQVQWKGLMAPKLTFLKIM